VNDTGDDLVPGKIHTIRRNFEWWKRFEGQDVALFYWEGKPYRSKQRVFCVKRIVSVQKLMYENWIGFAYHFSVPDMRDPVDRETFAENDGFANFEELLEWFHDYHSGDMAIIHFMDFRY
jgi:hypothetical protein